MNEWMNEWMNNSRINQWIKEVKIVTASKKWTSRCCEFCTHPDHHSYLDAVAAGCNWEKCCQHLERDTSRQRRHLVPAVNITISCHYHKLCSKTCSLIIGDPILIGSPIIVTIWKGVFTNKTRKLGLIWMKLGRRGWGLKRLSLARFQRNRAMGFGDIAKKWVAEVLFFCDVNHAPLLPLSLDWFAPNFPRTRVQVVVRDTWFHITEKFPLSGGISRKTVFLRYFRVPCLWSAYGSRETFCDAYTLSIH